MKKIEKFTEYQSEAIKYALANIKAKRSYAIIGLCGEVGEVAEKYKKSLRDYGGDPTFDYINFKKEIIKELGDVLWYMNLLAYQLDTDLEEIANVNIEKLNKRLKENKIKGSGDNR